jgi:hypothetical protein
VSQSNLVQLNGVLTAGPSGLSFGSCSLREIFPVSFCDCYAGLQGAVESNLISTDSGSPGLFTLPMGTITKGRVLALRILAGLTVKVFYTTGLGVAIFPVSDQFLIRARNPGDEFTRVQISTNGQAVDLGWLISGDVS